MKELESLSAFRARTGAFIFDSLPHSGGLETNPNLRLKAGGDGRLEPYAGNTVVFPLPEAAKQEIKQIQKQLYLLCAPALAEPLEAASFHITLHDLFSGKPGRDLDARIAGVRAAALACRERIAKTGETVRLHAAALFNMVNTSMVLGFAPADEESCERLMRYYEAFQEIVPLNYPLTPHVTVAYFRPGTVPDGMVAGLREAVDAAARREPILLELPAQTLEYQVFSDMNHYWTEQ